MTLVRAVSIAESARHGNQAPELLTVLYSRYIDPPLSMTGATTEEPTMIRWAIAFAILALIAGVFGFGGMAGDFAWIAKILLFVFLILLVISAVVGRGRGPIV